MNSTTKSSQTDVGIIDALLFSFLFFILPTGIISHYVDKKDHDLSLFKRVYSNQEAYFTSKDDLNTEMIFKRNVNLDGKKYLVKIPLTPLPSGCLKRDFFSYQTGETLVEIDYNSFPLGDTIEIFHSGERVKASSELIKDARNIGERLLENILESQEKEMGINLARAKKDLGIKTDYSN